MMSVLSLLFFSTLGCSAVAAPKQAFIIGGQQADVNEYPWLVVVRYLGFFICAGTILDKYNILTVAHCVVHDPEQQYAWFTVTAGEYNISSYEGAEQDRFVRKIIIHEEFVLKKLHNDIAIIKLDRPLDFGSNAVKPVGALSNKRFDRRAEAFPEQCFSAGWGISNNETREFPNVLQELSPTQIISNKNCNTLLNPDGFRVNSDKICTFNPGQGICLGDYGGPMGCYDQKGKFCQIGIMSWVPSQSCSDGRQVFTRVSRYRDWITEKMLQ